MMMKTIRCVLLGFIASVMVACGGGGGSSGANPSQAALTTTAGDAVILPSGAFRTYTISGGVPPYQVSSSEPAIAVGSISDKTLSIGAIAGGTANIRVFDFKGTVVSTAVTVGSSVALYTTAPSALKIGVGVTRTFAIGGGSPPYTVEGGNASVAVVTQTDATHWSITGKALGGSDELKIRDSAGATVTIAFTTEAPALRISPDKLTMPAGYEGEVTVTGGQPPYYPGGGIPAAVQVSPSVSQDGKFKIKGNLTSTLDVTFVDSAGQSVKVEVTINTATVSFRMSPSPISINENSVDELTFSMFGFYGDTGTGPSSGSVCIYSSDPSYLALDPSRTTCSTFSGSDRTFKIITGSRGKRCVSSDTPVQIRAVDTQGQVALGTITILDVGTACGAVDGSLTLNPSSVTVVVGGTSTVLISGGSGNYVASSLVGGVSASVSGSQLTVTGVAVMGEVDAVEISDVADSTKKAKLKVKVQ